MGSSSALGAAVKGTVKHREEFSITHLHLVISLDDPELDELWSLLSTTGLVVFLHPHYGLSSGAKEAWGDRDNGHVLPLALGFPMETTIVSFDFCHSRG